MSAVVFPDDWAPVSEEQRVAVQKWQTVMDGLRSSLHAAEEHFAACISVTEKQQAEVSSSVRHDQEVLDTVQAKTLEAFKVRFQALQAEQDEALARIEEQRKELDATRADLEADTRHTLEQLRAERDSDAGVAGLRARLARAKSALQAAMRGTDDFELPGDSPLPRAGSKWDLLRTSTKMVRWRKDPSLHSAASAVENELVRRWCVGR